MSLFDEKEPTPVNVLDFLRDHGIDETAAFHIVLRLLFTQTFAYEDDVRQAAGELNKPLPFIFPDAGRTH